MPVRNPRRPIPRAPLFIGLGLLVFTLAVTDLFGLVGGAGASNAAPVMAREFRFEDRADGAIVARDAATGAEVAVYDIGTNGFVRGTLRALARGRRQADLGHEIPFRVAAWSDGRVRLLDTATGREVELNAFGDTNKDVFLHLLIAAERK
ncbi:photosynthetic complex assembly protein PuhC [Dankookia sp. GCM10030260]|uniref:photosynthetic complex assembly protein PuhC n=1 Tax=Dankookia sp. GCM10030260 TaxID=3273390 RepID=UPI0036242162